MRIRKWMIPVLACTLFSFCGCSKEEASNELTDNENISVEGTYTEKLADSLDEAVIVALNQEKKEIQLYNITVGRTYSLTYDGTTSIKNRFSDELVAGQLASGDMVRVTFLKDEKRAKSIQLTDDYDTTKDVKGFEINSAARTIIYGQNQYTLAENTAIISEGRLAKLEDINAVDTLKLISKDHVVYGITVEKGHGYVRLSGQDAFVGGFLEIGQSLIKKVTDEMLLVVPEGEYTLQISNEGVAGAKDIIVARNQETLVDVSDLQTEQIKKTGKVIFSIIPTDATLILDGKETDYSEQLELDCGIHQMSVKAEGYKTLTQYIKVGTETANLNIELEKKSEDDESDDTVSDTVSKNSVTTTASASNYRVYIDAPVGAELYLDGSYIGIVPTSFGKTAGNYTISLRKSGYQTRSYSLQIDNSNKDVSYSFSNLEESKTE